MVPASGALAELFVGLFLWVGGLALRLPVKVTSQTYYILEGSEDVACAALHSSLFLLFKSGLCSSESPIPGVYIGMAHKSEASSSLALSCDFRVRGESYMTRRSQRCAARFANQIGLLAAKLSLHLASVWLKRKGQKSVNVGKDEARI